MAGHSRLPPVKFLQEYPLPSAVTISFVGFGRTSAHRRNSPRTMRKTRNASYGVCFRGVVGGGGRNRTGVHGFAGRCITTLPPRLGSALRPRATEAQTKR